MLEHFLKFPTRFITFLPLGKRNYCNGVKFSTCGFRRIFTLQSPLSPKNAVLAIGMANGEYMHLYEQCQHPEKLYSYIQILLIFITN